MTTSALASDFTVAGALVTSGDRLRRPIRTYQAAAEIAPDAAWPWYRLAAAHQAKGEIRETMAAIRRANARDGQTTATHAVLPLTPAFAIHMDCWGSGGSCEGSAQAARITAALQRVQRETPR